MDNLFFKIGCCLSEIGIVKNEQARSEIVSLKELKRIDLTYCYLKDGILFFLYEPLPRVHAV
ncbi:MAG: hypothetical protein LJE66_05495 [Desulfobacterales bacterium]|jgi:hypothetical protein|nr:hypothetical protein [Desulfobacterales bacterium]